LFFTIDILTPNNGIRHYDSEGTTVETARGVLITVARAIQFLQNFGTYDLAIDSSSIEDLVESFSFSEIRKGPCFSSVLCDTFSDKDMTP
jgi:hypothetical protein